MAARASAALEPSGPPAWAMSGRPPPPLPPVLSEATRTRSTALNLSVRSLVTATTMPSLPSAEALATATTPKPVAALVGERLRVFHIDAGDVRRRAS